MKPIEQTILKSEGVVGNCFQCCVASILDLPLEEVPHFCKSNNWPFNFYNWLGKRGLFWLECSFKEHGLDGNAENFGYHIISGPSPRGEFLHAVVGLNGEPHFDPHPDKTFLNGSIEDWLYGFIIRKIT